MHRQSRPNLMSLSMYLVNPIIMLHGRVIIGVACHQCVATGTIQLVSQDLFHGLAWLDASPTIAISVANTT